MGFVYRFDGKMDLSNALVDAIVDVDLMDMVSFSVAGFMLVRFEAVMCRLSREKSEFWERYNADEVIQCGSIYVCASRPRCSMNEFFVC
jgi:hypothetical protein